MNVFSRGLLLGAFLLLLILSACNFPTQTPSPAGTMLPEGETTATTLPTSMLSSPSPTVIIPVTGVDEVILQCQFCVNTEPHAALILSEASQFYVSDSTTRINCITAQVVNEKRILLCRGAEPASFSLNVCAANSVCLQYPVVLEPCQFDQRTTIATPVLLSPIFTAVPPTLPAETSTPLPTLPAPSQPPAVATTAPPPAITQTLPAAVATTSLPPQTGEPSLPTTRLPRTSLSDPEGFLHWYFEAVWRQRNYADLWENYLTPSFKSRPTAGGYEGYAAWWSSVQRVDVNSVDVLQNDGSHAWVRVNVTFTMLDGRVIGNQEYDYDLLYDPARQTWMFDYRT